MKVINIFGGPGSGKSTTAASVFSKMKLMQKNVELVTEFAKDMIWERNEAIFDNQFLIFAEQYRRLHRLRGQVDYVITDSPLLLQLVYNTEENIPCSFDTWKGFVLDVVDSFDNKNFLLIRQKEFNPTGRRHTLDEAVVLDQAIANMITLNTPSGKFIQLHGNETAAYQILDTILGGRK